jgi:peroxiredoxin 2/4
LKDFEKLNAKVIGVNTDSVYAHRAWLQSIGEIDYPLASDYTKVISRNYDILDEDAGIAQRGVFIIDPEQKIRYASVNDLMVGRNTNEILRVLAALNTKKACPINWQEGNPTL